MAAKKKTAVAEEPEPETVLASEHGPEPVQFDTPSRVARRDEWVCVVDGCHRPSVLHRLCDPHHAERWGQP